MKTRIFTTGAATLLYANNKAAAGTDTALNPYDLQVGTVGVYGVHKAGSTNLNKLVLITDGGGEAAGRVAAASFVGDQIFFAIGTTVGAAITGGFDVGKIKCKSQAYVAGVKQVVNVGYTNLATAGTLNEPSVIVRGDEAVLRIGEPLDNEQMLQSPRAYTGNALVDNASMYDILAAIVAKVYDDEYRIVDVDISSNGTPTYKTGTEDPTVTNGSRTITFAADPTLTAGAVLVIRGKIYKIASSESATSKTLDRPYRGTTETIDVSVETTVFGTMASITEYGLIVVDKSVDVKAAVAVGGIIQSATRSVSTAFVPSINSGAGIYKLEKESRSLSGAHDVIDRRVPIKDLVTDQSKNYDTYLVTGNNVRKSSDPHNHDNAHSTDIQVLVAFESNTADSGDTHQSDFEDILASLGITVSTLF